MDTALWNLFSFISMLLGIATAGAALWFVYAVGIPLRRWLDRELAKPVPGERARRFPE